MQVAPCTFGEVCLLARIFLAALLLEVVDPILTVTSATSIRGSARFVTVVDVGEATMERDINAERIEDHRLLQESLGLVAPVANELIASFYDQLFAEYPTVRSLFPAVMDAQREKLLKAIIALVTHYDRPEQLMPALSRFAGDAWTPEVERAWTRAYTFAAGAMMQGAEQAKAEDAAVPAKERQAA